MTKAGETCFQGVESLRVFAATGAPMRMGFPNELKISDKQKIATALKENDNATAIEYSQHAINNHMFIIMGFAEWCLRFPSEFTSQVSSDTERDMTSQVFTLWLEETNSLKTCKNSSNVINQLSDVFNPKTLSPETVIVFVDQLSKKQEQHVISPLLAYINNNFTSLVESIQQNKYSDALNHLETYFVSIQVAHDAMANYCSVYSSTVLKTFNQDKAELVTKKSFSNCSFYEGLFSLATSLNPEQLAAFYADHLRTHLSGDDRGGAVEIIENEDAYRLVFKPCGSGGALRNRVSNIATLPEAKPTTWNRKNEVPLYCSHCAMNELTYIERVGYPIVVTEFDPDPKKPCGWTVYKDPNKIPDYYFKRLGQKKEPSQFKNK